jgi:methyl-accepting chemotaxis protein
MTSRTARFPMFFKFLLGCLTLAALLIIGGTYVIKNETRLRSRGNYLAQAVRRLDGYVQRVGQGMTGAAELLATDDEIRDAVGKLAAGGAPDEALNESKQIFEALQSNDGIRPDAFAVFTAENRLVWAPPESPIDEKDLGVLAAVEKARGGSVFAHRIEMLGGVPYQVSAVPIRSNKTIVGGLLLGVKLQRYYEEWAEQTDERPELRMRPTLMDGGKVLASAWPAARLADFARQAQPDKIVKVAVGDDVRDVAKLWDGDYDIYTVDLEGYRNLDPVAVGKLAITRSRVQLSDPSESLPWAEIAGGIVLSVLVALAMGLLITRPIKQFVRQSRKLLEGETDLTQRLEVSSHDETGALAENINQVFARLHQLATGVQSAAFQVGASSAEISAASRQMLSGLKDQTLKIESSTTAVTELSASIQTVAGNAAQATQVAEQSSTAVTSAVERMESIRAAVADAAEKMRELGESSKRIGNIVEVIRQISEQTSMLALNASIEAAHAGEQGRGFAVVADEVSSLARRVGQSARDIETLIQTVKEQTQAVMASMEVGTREVASGSQLVTGTLTGLGQLISVVKDTAGAVHEQAVVSDEIARNMDSVRQIATEVLSGSEESVVQAERLHELAFELEESIGGFNLDGHKLAKANPARAAPKPKTGDPAQRALPGGTPRPARPAPAEVDH